MIKKIKKAGNINAAHEAIIFDKYGKEIGSCMDTPNNAAFAFSMNDNAAKIVTPFNGTWLRSDLIMRFIPASDMSYHAQYINFI